MSTCVSLLNLLRFGVVFNRFLTNVWVLWLCSRRSPVAQWCECKRDGCGFDPTCVNEILNIFIFSLYIYQYGQQCFNGKGCINTRFSGTLWLTTPLCAGYNVISWKLCMKCLTENAMVANSISIKGNKLLSFPYP